MTDLPPRMQRMYAIKRKFSITPEKIADTYLWLAADPVVAQQTSGYWDAPGVPVRANRNAYNKATQKALWDISAEMTGVRT